MVEDIDKTCAKCGGKLEAGFTTAAGLIGGSGIEHGVPRLQFVVPGMPTSGNPLRAFKQGVAGELDAQRYLVRGYRCAVCGALELYATKE